MDLLDIAIAKQLAGGGGGSGTDNYNDLSNLPKINDTTLSGNKTSANLGLQSEINSDSKLASDLVDDTDQDNKFVTTTEKNTWNGKQNAIDSDHKLSSDLVDDANKTNKFVTSTEKNTWNAKQNAIDSDHKLSSDLVDDANKTNKFVTTTEKNTWNGKQNAIDADHKLSSSFVSFSTAEAAALASGIDSTKVGQISTNQTNISLVQDATEELVDNGAKNRFDDVGWMNYTSVIKGTKSISNGAITITATDNDCYTDYYSSDYPPIYDIPVSEGETIVLSWEYVANSSQSNDTVYIFDNELTPVGNVPASQGYITYTIPSGCTYLRFRLGVSTSGNSATYSKIMVTTKVEYDISDEYEPFALPNSELTKLESEDRAALVEQVDEGAKNLFDDNNITELERLSQSGNVYTATVNDTANKFNLMGYQATPSAVVARSIYTPDIDTNGVVFGVFTKDPSATLLIIGHSGTTINNDIRFDISSLVNGEQYVLAINITQYNPQNTLQFKDVMICTKSKFDISPAHAPFALPNSELTKLESEDRNSIQHLVYDGGGRNILKLSDLSEIKSQCGTLNVSMSDDYTLTVSGSDTSAHFANIAIVTPSKTGDYTFSSVDGDVNKCAAYIKIGDAYYWAYSGFTSKIPMVAGTSYTVVLRYLANTTGTYNFKFMLREADIADTTYQPYALPNYDLTVREAEDRAALAEQVDEGAKNKLRLDLATIKALNPDGTWNGNTFTRDGLTFTINSDMTISASGTASGNVSLGLYSTDNTSFDGDMILSGCPDGGDYYTKYSVYIADSQGSTILSTADSNGTLIAANTVFKYMLILVRSGTNVTGLTFKPMICSTADWKISQNFTTHALQNTDLTQEVNALHERTDQIQPALSFDAEVPGWYRVFTLGSVPSVVAVGAYDNSCDIIIKRLFANTNNEHHEIKLASIFENMGFTDEFSKSAVLLITNIRYVSTNDTAYIDIYYSGSVANRIICFINNNVGAPWKAVNTVSRVSETTTGETVWASYDFNANYDPSFLAAKANYNVQYGLSDGSWSCSTPNTYEYTGLSITVPANQIYEIQAYDYVSNANVLGLAIGVNSTDIDTQDYTMVAEAVDVNSASHHYLCRNVSCLSALGNAKTYYLFAKHETVGANLIALMWRRIV